MVTQIGGRRKRRTGKKRKASKAFLKAGNKWRSHVKDTMKANPDMKFGKSLLKLASKTYKKGSVTLPPAATRMSRPTKKRRTKKRTRKRTRKRKTGGFLGF